MTRTAAFTASVGAMLALLVTACASTGQGADPADLAGCYYFDQDAVAAELQLPWGVRLLDRPLEGWPALQQLEGVRLATTLTGRAEADHPFGYWRVVSADSIIVGYPAGGGLSVHLAPDERGMAGTVRAVGDATLQATRPSHPVRLLRARCPEDL